MRESMGRVGVLYGGTSAEREVSLRSGAAVCQALCAEGVDARLFDTGKQSLAQLAAAGFDRVFIVLHGRHGEDGTIQGALELLGIPYTGSGPLASSLAMDKVLTKQLWLHHGLPTPAFACVPEGAEVSALAQEPGFPMVIKPSHEGSTLGLTRVEAAAQLPSAIALARQYDRSVLAEAFVQGRELTVPLLGSGEHTRALPVIEIMAPQGNYDYEHKYLSDETRYDCPADLTPELAARVRQLAEASYRVLGCEGWGRADLMLDAQHEPWLLEMNTCPGMTDHSLVPMGARAAGMTFGALCLEILSTARCKVGAPADG